MNPKLQHIEEAESHKIEKLVPLFQIYVGSKFGMDSWERYMEDEVFATFMEDYYPRYGDMVFKNLADYVVEVEQLSIKNLLRDFSSFVHEYY